MTPATFSASPTRSSSFRRSRLSVIMPSSDTRAICRRSRSPLSLETRRAPAASVRAITASTRQNESWRLTRRRSRMVSVSRLMLLPCRLRAANRLRGWLEIRPQRRAIQRLDSQNVRSAARGESRAPLISRVRGRLLFGLVLLGLVLALLDGCFEDVAERSTRVGRAILSHRLLLLGQLELLDRDRDPPARLVDADHRGIDLVADVEALRPLLSTVTRQVRAFDEARHIGADDLDLDAIVLDRDHFAGDRITLLVAADHIERIARKLLDSERDPFLGRVHVEDHGLDHVALFVLLDDLVARAVPI